MGVEYQHFLAVNEPDWLPAPDTLGRVEAVLRQWSLAGPLQRVVDLSDRRTQTLAAPERRHQEAGPGLVAVYEGISGAAAERIAGPSIYVAMPEERYLQEVAIVVGSDYRVFFGSESAFFEVTSPAKDGGKALLPFQFEVPAGWGGIGTLFGESFPGSAGTAPPVVKIEMENYSPGNLLGFWRGAVVIDFGKDLPAFVEENHLLLPNREFVQAVAEAFRSQVGEFGAIY